MQNEFSWIVDRLPYTNPFLFVDIIQEVDEDHVVGSFTFRKDLVFYEGHFKNNPITPGVILTECMAQIGLVSLGIYLMKDKSIDNLAIGLTSAKTDFYIPVLPGETVRVESIKEVFRFNKLKCSCKMYNADEKLVCKGDIAGMLKV